MSGFEVDCEGFGTLRFPGGRKNDGYDFVVRANDGGCAPDVLAFFDSRGISAAYAGSLAEQVVQHLDGASRRYLLVCRPLELTTWATLLNFIAANALEPQRIVTNLGFVDFTPKKLSILEDSIQQVEFLLGPGVASSHFVEHYITSDGADTPLFAMSYEDAYRRGIEALAATRPLVVLNTPIVDAGIRVQRKRPRSFYEALCHTQAFNRSIRGAVVVDPPDFDERLTYDAVHYTHAGNDLMFEKLREHL